MQDLKIAFVQSDLYWNDTHANLLHFEKHLQALSEAVDLVVLPEMFNTGFLVEPQKMPATAAVQAVEWLRQQANTYQTVFCASLIVQDNGRYYNRLHWVQPNGNIHFYNKRHLFTYGNEDRYFDAGTNALVVQLKNWHIKPLICYDLRFPVWAKNNLQQGCYDYDMLIYIANWPASRMHAWRTLLQARAIENQVYVLGVNRVGADANGTMHSGSSLLISPKGDIISTEVNKGEESVQIHTLSYEILQQFRQDFPVGNDWDTFKVLN